MTIYPTPTVTPLPDDRATLAGLAMHALIMSDPDINYEVAARYAVKHADVLLAELQRTQPAYPRLYRCDISTDAAQHNGEAI